MPIKAIKDTEGIMRIKATLRPNGKFAAAYPYHDDLGKYDRNIIYGDTEELCKENLLKFHGKVLSGLVKSIRR